jgi:glycosyltransferase involved in cell wall biosynthesis
VPHDDAAWINHVLSGLENPIGSWKSRGAAMRILALTNLYPNPYQPHRATFNRQQIRALADRHAVSVIAPILWTDEAAARRKDGCQLRGERTGYCDEIPVRYPRYLYTPWVLRGLYGRFFQMSVRRDFRKSLIEFRPDLIFAPWVYPDGWAAVRLARQAGLPVVLKAHGSDVLLSAAYRGRSRRTVEAMQRADATIAVSRDLAERIGAVGVPAKRIRVVYDGVNLAQFHPGSKEEARSKLGLGLQERMAVFIGNLLPVKGVDVLIQACAHLSRQGVNFVCCLIGDGPLRLPLEKQVRENGLSERVRLVGPMPHATLPDWYRAADVFVLPSRSEGVPCVLLEALACGTPFVASRVGGIPEIAGLGPSRLVASGNVEELAQAMAEQLLRVQNTSVGPGLQRSHEDAASEMSELFEQVLEAHRFAPASPDSGHNSINPPRSPHQCPL